MNFKTLQTDFGETLMEGDNRLDFEDDPDVFLWIQDSEYFLPLQKIPGLVQLKGAIHLGFT